MPNIYLVMSLTDFVPYVKDILIKHKAFIYVEKRTEIINVEYLKIDLTKEDLPFETNRGKHMRFYLTTKEFTKDENHFYTEPLMFYCMDGVGGRETIDQIEKIALRIIAKTPDSSITKLFNAIKYRLKKDTEIGQGIGDKRGLDKYVFYDKKYINNKIVRTDFYNNALVGSKILE